MAKRMLEDPAFIVRMLDINPTILLLDEIGRSGASVVKQKRNLRMLLHECRSRLPPAQSGISLSAAMRQTARRDAWRHSKRAPEVTTMPPPGSCDARRVNTIRRN